MWQPSYYTIMNQNSLSNGFQFQASANWVGLDMTAYSDSLCQSCDGLCSWPPPENVPTPSASLNLGKKSRRSSEESPCRSGPPSRLKSSDDRVKRKEGNINIFQTR